MATTELDLAQPYAHARPFSQSVAEWHNELAYAQVEAGRMCQWKWFNKKQGWRVQFLEKVIHATNKGNVNENGVT